MPTAIMVLGIKREVGALPPDIHALPASLLGCDSGQAETSILQPAALGTVVQLVHCKPVEREQSGVYEGHFRAETRS